MSKQDINEKPPTTQDGEQVGSTALFAAFDAKIRWCEDKARECYEDRDENCSDIGKYYDAAKAEITRFRNELFPAKKKATTSNVRCHKCRITIGGCWADTSCPNCGYLIEANDPSAGTGEAR